MTKRGIDDLSFSNGSLTSTTTSGAVNDLIIKQTDSISATNAASNTSADIITSNETYYNNNSNNNSSHQQTTINGMPINGGIKSSLSTNNINGTVTGSGGLSNGRTGTDETNCNNNSNGSLIVTTTTSSSNSTKKFKSDNNNNNGAASGKSRVVHIRNIPSDTTTSELMYIATPFGNVTKHLFVRSKGQAFVEFESHFSAMQMASHWIQTTIGGIPTQVQPTIRGRHVHVQISNHKELKTQFENQNNNNGSNGNNSNQNSSTTSSNGSSIATITNGQLNDIYGFTTTSTSIDNTTDNHTLSSAGITSTPSPVIRVVVENHLYPMTLDCLYQVFMRCGKVLKIVTFNKNQQFQALIQFSDVASAIQAKTNYDDQPIYGSSSIGFNIMRIEYSKLQNLIVKYNNEKSRDYTTVTSSASTVSSGSNVQNGTQSLTNGNLTSANHHLNHPGEQTDALYNQTLGLSTAFATGPLTAAAMGHINGHQAGAGGTSLAANLAAAAAFNPSSARFLSGQANSLQQALSVQAALTSGSLITPSNAAAAAMFAGLQSNLIFSSVVHVSGLNPEHVTPDALFTLFGVYGDVVRVKILFNKKDTALIQMAEPTQAQNAISYLDRTKLFGRAIHVTTSKHQVVQMPKEGHQDSGLTKDYTNSPLHRFKRPGSKNYNNIYPPSETLHISNIPSTCTEQDLRISFQKETGKEISKFKFFPNDHRMALIQFDSIENAIIALIKMHNFKVADHSHLRVSFSKSPV